MTLDQLRMLIKIAEEGSVFAAAEALHRTQPTVSVAIKNLEKELGVALLDREQYRATLTNEGKILCEKGKSILQQVGLFEGLAEHLAIGNEPQLHIAIGSSCRVPLMLQIMRICNERFANTQFSFSVENIMGALEKLSLNHADLAITPFAELDSTLESFRLTETEMVRIAASDFPLCSEHEPVQFSQLQQHVQVIVRDSSSNPPDETYNVLDGGRHWYVNDHYTKKELILSGMCWGMLHLHLVEDELLDGRLKLLEVENHPISKTFSISAARKANQTHGPVATALWAALQELVEEEAEFNASALI